MLVGIKVNAERDLHTNFQNGTGQVALAQHQRKTTTITTVKSFF